MEHIEGFLDGNELAVIDGAGVAVGEVDGRLEGIVVGVGVGDIK